MTPATDQPSPPCTVVVVDDISEMRELARRVLRELRSDLVQSEARHAETGQPDPMKVVTGTSALERAVTTTRGMLDRMHALTPVGTPSRRSAERPARPRRLFPLSHAAV